MKTPTVCDPDVQSLQAHRQRWMSFVVARGTYDDELQCANRLSLAFDGFLPTAFHSTGPKVLRLCVLELRTCAQHSAGRHQSSWKFCCEATSQATGLISNSLVHLSSPALLSSTWCQPTPPRIPTTPAGRRAAARSGNTKGGLQVWLSM